MKNKGLFALMLATAILFTMLVTPKMINEINSTDSFIPLYDETETNDGNVEVLPDHNGGFFIIDKDKNEIKYFDGTNLSKGPTFSDNYIGAKVCNGNLYILIEKNDQVKIYKYTQDNDTINEMFTIDVINVFSTASNNSCFNSLAIGADDAVFNIISKETSDMLAELNVGTQSILSNNGWQVYNSDIKGNVTEKNKNKSATFICVNPSGTRLYALTGANEANLLIYNTATKAQITVTEGNTKFDHFCFLTEDIILVENTGEVYKIEETTADGTTSATITKIFEAGTEGEGDSKQVIPVTQLHDGDTECMVHRTDNNTSINLYSLKTSETTEPANCNYIKSEKRYTAHNINKVLKLAISKKPSVASPTPTAASPEGAVPLTPVSETGGAVSEVTPTTEATSTETCIALVSYTDTSGDTDSGGSVSAAGETPKIGIKVLSTSDFESVFANLTFGEYAVDEAKLKITGVPANTTVADFKTKITCEDYTVTIASGENQLKETDTVPTGATVTFAIYDVTKEYTIIVNEASDDSGSKNDEPEKPSEPSSPGDDSDDDSGNNGGNVGDTGEGPVVTITTYKVENDIISEVLLGTKPIDFMKNVTHNDCIVSFKKRSGGNINEGKIPTGATVTFEKNGQTKTFKIVVDGDLTGEGNVNSSDTDALVKHLLGKSSITDKLFLLASDLNNDGTINTLDLLALSKMLKTQ